VPARGRGGEEEEGDEGGREEERERLGDEGVGEVKAECRRESKEGGVG